MFYKFRCVMARFMYGRNGMDQMNQAFWWGYIGILLAEILFNLLRLRAPAIACEALLWVLMVFILFRMFSKNLPKRREENQKFMNWFWKIKATPPEPGPPGGQGSQVLHLQVRRRVPCRWGQGKNRHHLPQVRGEDPRGTGKKKPEDAASSGLLFDVDPRRALLFHGLVFQLVITPAAPLVYGVLQRCCGLRRSARSGIRWGSTVPSARM